MLNECLVEHLLNNSSFKNSILIDTDIKRIYKILNIIKVFLERQVIHWKQRVVMMPTLSSLVAPEVVKITTFGATSDGKDGIMTTLSFSVFI